MCKLKHVFYLHFDDTFYLKPIILLQIVIAHKNQKEHPLLLGCSQYNTN